MALAKKSLEDLIIDEATIYGPVVAIGNPSDPFPPYGAARGYYDDKDWQQAVERLMTDAHSIILQADESQGLQWEMERVIGSDLAKKALFLVPPQFALGANGEGLLARLRPPPSTNTDQKLLGLFFDGQRNLRRLESSDVTETSYLLAMRRFFSFRTGDGADNGSVAQSTILETKPARRSKTLAPVYELSPLEIGSMVLVAVVLGSLADLLIAYKLGEWGLRVGINWPFRDLVLAGLTVIALFALFRLFSQQRRAVLTSLGLVGVIAAYMGSDTIGPWTIRALALVPLGNTIYGSGGEVVADALYKVLANTIIFICFPLMYLSILLKKWRWLLIVPLAFLLGLVCLFWMTRAIEVARSISNGFAGKLDLGVRLSLLTAYVFRYIEVPVLAWMMTVVAATVLQNAPISRR
jgi:hypothetical protein